MTNKWLELNKESWNERAPINVRSDFYDNDAFKAGRSISPNWAPKIEKYDFMKSSSNKILIGDGPWMGNSKFAYASNRWHDSKSRKYNILFADGHVKFTSFSSAIEDWEFFTTIDSSYTWW